jgi:SAM-dependent MidA family methyltransferase
MFGELVGLWAVEVWQAMGGPAPLRLVELGPGRGTLMADALRAARLVPAFRAAASVHLVETSPALRERQKNALAPAGAEIHWHERIEDVPAGPAIVIANEFFDALPIRQFAATARGWCERLVGLQEGDLAFGLTAEPETGICEVPTAGAVLERSDEAVAVIGLLAHRLVRQGGAALLVDYGYVEPGTGDTLQAVRRHSRANPLQDPGEADLTAHVDFRSLGNAATMAGARLHGPATQGEFLLALGIETRASLLKRRATPAQAEEIDRALERLTGSSPEAMGELFKVLGLSHPDLGALPGLRPGGVRSSSGN